MELSRVWPDIFMKRLGFSKWKGMKTARKLLKLNNCQTAQRLNNCQTAQRLNNCQTAQRLNNCQTAQRLNKKIVKLQFLEYVQK